MEAVAICVGKETAGSDYQGLWFVTLVGFSTMSQGLRRYADRTVGHYYDLERALDVAHIVSNAREDRPTVFAELGSGAPLPDLKTVVGEPQKYTVILLSPASMADVYGQDTYMTCVEAHHSDDAIVLAREELASIVNDEELDTADLYCIACIEGEHQDLS